MTTRRRRCTWCSELIPLRFELMAIDAVGARHWFHPLCMEHFRSWMCGEENVSERTLWARAKRRTERRLKR